MKEDNNYLPFQKKLTKAPNNNFKIDIKGISGRLEMCKNIISAYIVIYRVIENCIPSCS